MLSQDPITLERAGLLHPACRVSFLTGYRLVLDAGIGIRMTQGLRTFKEQDGFYAIGRTVMGKNPTEKMPMGQIITWARGGYSYHNYGLAFDFCLLHQDKTVSFSLNEDIDSDLIKDWVEVVNIFGDMNWSSGINWPRPKQDPPHFQMTFGKSIATLRAMYGSKQLDPDGYLKLVA